MAAMYAVYHGPAGLHRIANKVHGFAQVFKSSVESFGYSIVNDSFFDTVTVKVPNAKKLHDISISVGINLRCIDDLHVGITFDESVATNDLVSLINVFAAASSSSSVSLAQLQEPDASAIPSKLQRTSTFLPHPVFNKHHSETEMLRYINHLASKDVGLVHSMIPLGSCTMKLNSTSSMIPLTWAEYSCIHPFVPFDQVEGYHTIIRVRSVSCSSIILLNVHTTRNWSRTLLESLVFPRPPFNRTLVLLANTLVYVSSVPTTSPVERVIGTYA
jgi:glycine dehydrogenase